MNWKLPPKIKIYEALGCIGDKRIEIKENHAKVFSSSKNKFYSVEYSPESNAISSNDNGSYWVGYLGYPSIAFLMLKGILNYNPNFAEKLNGIPWKDINVQFKNDFDKTEKHILRLLEKKGQDIPTLLAEIDSISEQIKIIEIKKLQRQIKPPEGY
jgi:hypothetical protein